MAHYLKDAFVYGIDISDIAFKIANKNKERLNILNAKFFQGDLFEALNEEEYEGFFTIITSNPPYIKRDIIDTLQVEVKDFEPKLALDGGPDGLDFYRRISFKSRNFLKKDGLLIYEIGYDQGQSVKDILILNNFKRIEIVRDLQGHDRVVLGFK